MAIRVNDFMFGLLFGGMSYVPMSEERGGA
jgi:hypothetical protein